jgi:hypothetical protein
MHNQDFPFDILDVASILGLQIRRNQANSVYTDCPFCGDTRGKFNINHVKNVYRCNYCGEKGGMLDLYAKTRNTNRSGAYGAINELLHTGAISYGFKSAVKKSAVENSELAAPEVVSETLTQMLKLLQLSDVHRWSLRKRGLTDEQIDSLGYRSTPDPKLCLPLTERLIEQGFTVEGVPGFWLRKDGRRTVNFGKRTSGILIPYRGIDGRIGGLQIRLDVPLKRKGDPQKGAKYIWSSSVNDNQGVSSECSVHFVGNPYATTVYVTEGALKADVAHNLMNRTFAATAGVNNVSKLDALFTRLVRNGTKLIVEAEDMDKYVNTAVADGAAKVRDAALRHGMDCRTLTWVGYKGVDDWQLALKLRQQQAKISTMIPVFA